MKKRFIHTVGVFCFLLVIPLQFVSAFDEVTLTDVRSLSLGKVRSLSQGLQNPATLSFVKRGEVTVSVYNRFAMKELNTVGLQGVLPGKNWGGGAGLSAYGYAEYRLWHGQVALAKRLTPTLALGADLAAFYESSLFRERDRQYISAGLGLFWQLSPKMALGLTGRNLLHTIPHAERSLHLGISYQLFPGCELLLEGSSDFRRERRISAGVEYSLIDSLVVRAGYCTASSAPTAGAAWTTGRWKIECVFLWHDMLGLSSAIAAGFFF